MIAVNGVNLRTGPDLDDNLYTTLVVLRSGTPLEILRQVVAKPDWLKVSVTSNSDEMRLGYIQITPDSIRINKKNLADISAIYEFGPHLLKPNRFETIPVEGITEFSWQAVALPLAEHQYYSLLILQDGLSEDQACYHWQTKDTAVSIKPQDYNCTPGSYHWRVGLATDLNEGVGERNWRDDSEQDERNPLGIGVPHPDKPKGGGGGGSNDNGGGIVGPKD